MIVNSQMLKEGRYEHLFILVQDILKQSIFNEQIYKNNA